MSSAPKPIQQRQVQPAVDNNIADVQPTLTRYGWCPFRDIMLSSPGGSPYLYVQPHEVNVGGVNVSNPLHFMLPAGELIPFPTFGAIENTLDPDNLRPDGSPTNVMSERQVTALAAISQVDSQYNAWGFTVLHSLQGLDQNTAFRIFAVVMPLNYALGDLAYELSTGAEERINANSLITFPDIPSYVVDPLQNDTERSVARLLAVELTEGAMRAVTLANEILDKTAMGMTLRVGGGAGKPVPDALDRELSRSLGRDLPKVVSDGKDNSGLAQLQEQVGFLVNREASRQDKETIAELQAQIEAMKSGNVATSGYVQTGDMPDVPYTTTATNNVDVCGAPTASGKPCGNFKPCRHHGDKE